MSESNKQSNNQPFVTIVTPSFNLIKSGRKDFFEQNLKSVHDQTYKNIEHIIVDGASNDGTIDLIKKYADKGWIKYISEKDKGIYDAMNKGIKMAKGKYIAFLGSDDYYHDKDGVKKVVKALEKGDADFTYAPVRLVNNKDEEVLMQHSSRKPDIKNINFKMPFCHQTMFTRTDVMLKEDMFNTQFTISADYDFLVRIYLKGYKAIFVNFEFATYSIDGMSSMNHKLFELENMKARNELGLLPLVSIIMPSYNHAPYIEETLDSVLAQIYPNWECIIVDDGSTDETEKVVQKYLKKDSRFKYIKQKNSGPSAARNNGIANSAGEFILPLDSDDKISTRYIKEAVDVFIEKPKTKLVYCEAEFFGEKKGKWELPEYSYDKILCRNVIFCSAVFKRVDYNKTNGYNVNMTSGLEDWDFWLSLLNEKDIVYRIKKVHFYYRIKNLSRNADLLKKDFLLQKKMYKQVFLNHLDVYLDKLNPLYTELALNNEIKKMDNKISRNKEVFENQIKQKNKEIQKKNDEIVRVNKVVTSLKSSKSLKIGDSFFRSIKKPHKLITFPFNFFIIIFNINKRVKLNSFKDILRLSIKLVIKIKKLIFPKSIFKK